MLFSQMCFNSLEKVKKLDGILLDVFMTLHLLSDSTTKLEENNIKIDHLVERPGKYLYNIIWACKMPFLLNL